MRRWWIWGSGLALMVLSISVGVLLWIQRCGVGEIRPTGSSRLQDAPSIASRSDNWHCWRGPDGDATSAKATLPLLWSDSNAVLWKIEVPGRGHSSPIVWNRHIFLTTADEESKTLSILCYEGEAGKLMWSTPIYQGPFMARHEKNSHASATPICDGHNVYTAYIAEGSLWLSAVDMAGHFAWKTQIGPFVTQWGYGSSPTLYKDLIIVNGDNRGDRLANVAALTSYLAAVRTSTGEILWRVRRPRDTSFGAPIVAELSGRPQLLLGGAGQITSYDPATGDELWLCRWSGSRSASAVAFSRDRVFASTNVDGIETMCVKADGAGDVTDSHLVWRQKKGAADIPSPLYHDGLVFLVSDKGMASCLEAESGKVVWHERLQGAFSASPLLAGGRLYATNEAGTTFVLQASRQFEILATNHLNDEVLASPVPMGNRLLIRGKRYLWCLGNDTSRNDLRLGASPQSGDGRLAQTHGE